MPHDYFQCNVFNGVIHMENINNTPPPKLLDLLRAKIRMRHYSLRTEMQYVHWVRRFILYHDKKHPQDMGGPEVKAFLTDLAVRAQVAASTQNQALSALLFLQREVLSIELPWMQSPVWPFSIPRITLRRSPLSGQNWPWSSAKPFGKLKASPSTWLKARRVGLPRSH